jgi:hypothetical protein
MPSRRPHEKRRNGCHQCKSRRVKCDLQVPVCRNCVRRSEPCVRDRLSSPASLAAPYAISTPTLQAESLPLLELELLHHFTTTVYGTLSEEIDIQSVWQRDVPKEALRHTHLMHATLALSALHLQHITEGIQSGTTYRKSAIHHYGIALSQLRPLIVQINPANCGSVLATSALLGFFTFVYSRFQEGKSTLINSLTSIHEVLRGVAAIITHSGSHLNGTTVSNIFKPGPWNDAPIPVGFQRAIGTLRANISTFGEEHEREIHFAAVHTLQENVKAEIANPQRITLSYMFLTLVDRRYMELLAARNQMALVILAYYAIILHRQRNWWGVNDAGVQVLKEVKECLNGDFAALVKWPEQWLAGHDDMKTIEAHDYYSWTNILVPDT